MEIEIRRTFDLLDHLVVNHPKDDILAGKVNGEWVRYSSHDYYKFAHFLAYGFLEMGLQPGDRVVTISHNCPEWNFVDMALAMARLVHVPVYPTLSTENYLHIFRHSEAKAVLVSSKKLLGHIKASLEKMDNAPKVFTMNQVEGVPRILEILKLGIANRDKHMATIEQNKRDISPDEWFTLIYTSGTTGAPKGVMLSHRNMCSNFIAHSKVNIVDSSARAISFLPLNHVYERSLNYHYQLLGVSIYYAENMGTIVRDIHDVQANIFCAVPRVLEMIYDKLYAAGKDLQGLKKKVYDKAISFGEKYDFTKPHYSPWTRFVHNFYDKNVYCKWREKFGGAPEFTIITGSSAIQLRMLKLFGAANFRIYEGYGLSETSPVIAVNNPHDHLVRLGTVGPILEGVEMKFADDGEILTRGPHVMLGYYKDPEYTAQVIDEDGWFHTGDVGKLVADRYLKITDRKKDIFKLSAGKYVAPQIIENKLRESDYIDQVMVVGENEKCAAAIISPNFNTLHYWALKHNLHYRSNIELIQLPEVNKKMKEVVEEYNQEFAPHEQIKSIKLVSEEWTVDSGMLSPTLKIKRNVLLEKYKGVIADMYNRQEETKSGLFSAFRSIELPSIKFPGRKD